MPRRLQTVLIILISLLSVSLNAKERIYYKINHDTCRVKIVDNFKSSEDMNYKDLVVDLLKERNYQTSFLGPRRKIITGDFHLNFSWNRTGENVYKACDVEVTLKRSRINRTQSDDKVIFENSSKRALPRVTFKGKERCRRAINDVFNLLPHCILRKK
ncbi:hypothetical protein A9Q84_18000 [Halobacteriovorax marinus]|uniref:Uncharacterized protein n=1 Tax=Halobacteriovorax marinus TaxID=97084 RepID=A0A1Y5F3C6_9BACT|nr:hypothetical protein A9Q84_18000 [Halobacteriovorax marinus]